MSLTSFINIPDVRKKFREEFPKQPVPWNLDPLAPPRTTNYALMGTAFDYLLRFYLKRLNPKAKTSPWVAEIVARLLSPNSELQKKAVSIVARTKRSYSNYLRNGVINRTLLKNVILLAGLDPIYRAGRGVEYVGRVEEDDIRDLKTLISLVDRKLFKARSVVRLNPTFGEASEMVAGGDADIIIDDTLIDIKTTKHMKVRRETYNQLIGYYTLATLGGIDGLQKGHQIHRLAIYFSRFGQLVTFSVAEVIDHNRFPSFVQWFKDRVDQEKKMLLANFATKLHKTAATTTFTHSHGHENS